MTQGIDITAVSKLKHADLYAAAKKMGGQSALAKHLGVHPSRLGNWCNLKSVPPASPVPGTIWTEDLLRDLEAKLVVLTGKSWEELFPQALRDATEFLESSKTIERTERIESYALASYAERESQRLSDYSSASRLIEDEERATELEAVERCLKTLSYREREIIKLRFGLGEYCSYTLEEVAAIFKVTAARIRQIEQKAIRKLQQPSRAAEMLPLLRRMES